MAMFVDTLAWLQRSVNGKPLALLKGRFLTAKNESDLKSISVSLLVQAVAQDFAQVCSVIR